MNWDHPEPGVYEAFTKVPVALEVLDPEDGDDTFHWWAVSKGKVLAEGVAPSVDEAKHQCEASVL